MRDYNALVPPEKQIRIGDVPVYPGQHITVVTAKGERRPYRITEVWMANQEFLTGDEKNPRITCFSTQEELKNMLAMHPNLPLRHQFNVWAVLEGAGPRLMFFIYEIIAALEPGDILNPHKTP